MLIFKIEEAQLTESLDMKAIAIEEKLALTPRRVIVFPPNTL